VDGLPAGFRYHDLRHYLASLLIAKGGDVKTVHARLRHASAKTTLDTPTATCGQTRTSPRASRWTPYCKIVRTKCAAR
jgi:integrase